MKLVTCCETIGEAKKKKIDVGENIVVQQIIILSEANIHQWNGIEKEEPAEKQKKDAP